MSAVSILASVPPTELLARERQKAFQLHKEDSQAEITPHTIVSLILESEEFWKHIESSITQVMRMTEVSRQKVVPFLILGQ